MITLVLIVVYIAFIGIGFPNTIFGAAWPAMYEDLSLPLSAANYVNILVPGCTAIASLFSARLVKRFGTAKVAFVGSIILTLTLIGFSVSENLISLCLCAIPLGLTAGVLDAALNNYVATHYKPMFTSFLHCSFGIGASLSLYLMSAMLSRSDWNNGYRMVALVQFGITALVLVIMPAWRRMENSAESYEEHTGSRTLRLIDMMKMPLVCMIWIISFSTNALEGVCSAWGSSYLVLAHDFGPDAAAKAISAFTIGMTLGRFGSGLMTAKMSGWKIIYIGSAVTLTGIVFIFVPSALFVKVGFFLLGLGNGPIYPMLILLIPQKFGVEISGSVIGSLIAFTYLGFMLGPAVFGYIAQYISAKVLPVYLLMLFGTMLFSIYVYVYKSRNKKIEYSE